MATLRRATHRHVVRGLLVAAAVSIPLVLLPTAGSAAPTLTIAQAQQQLAALQTKQDAAVEAYNAGQIALTAAQRGVQTAKTSVARQQKKVAAVQGQLADLARMAYMTGGVDPVTGLLSGQGSATIVDKVGNLDQIARVRTDQTVALRSEQTRLTALQAVSKDKLATAAAKAKQLETAKAQVTTLVAQQQAVLNRLQADARRQLLAQEAAERAAAQAAAAKAVPVVQRATAPGSASTFSTVTSASAPVTAVPSGGGAGQIALHAALSMQGVPYRYGGASPSGFDCSGLVMWAFAHAGISLPHSAAGQYGYGTHVSRGQLQAGDIVFFNEGGGIGHDGIYVGGGMFIDANHTGGWVGVRNMSYYSGFVGGTRL